MENYDPNKNYTFRDANGNVLFTSKGDNGYVWQSMTEGIPIYINDKGEWYTQPYLESTPTGVVLHNTDWFKGTKEYEEWKNTYLPQIQSRSLDVDLFNNAQEILKGLGNQGLLRVSTYKQVEDAGITDPHIKQFAFDQYLDAINEGVNKKAANLVAYTPDYTEAKEEDGQSVADLARYYKSLSKEDLSKKIMQWEYMLSHDNTSQADKANIYTTYKILNLVADSPADFGDGKEFEGLLEASEWQKFQTHINNVVQTISENLPIVTFGARLGAGLGSMTAGKSFAEGWQIEKRRDQQYGYLRSEATGGGLRGTEGSAVSGTWAGAIVSMAGTVVESMAFGKWFGGTKLGMTVGGLLKGGSSTLGQLGGGMVYDFFFNDLPVDLSLFAADLASTGSAQEAWESQEGNTQPLFGLFGPNVPAGLKYNLIGDAVLDLTIPIAGITNRAIWTKLDDITGGSVTKIREDVAIKNLAVQQRISDMPVIGTGLQKFSNWLFGAENASFIREKRKEAIIEKSMTPYIDAQNLLTLKNHYGAEVVAPLYKRLVDELGINDQIEKFQKNARELGGIGKVEVEWDSARGGVKKHISETVIDDIPRDVKRGLLDYQRLEELKGERMAEGEGLINNPKRDKEITALERRVENLPDDIKKFAADFSELNKRVEKLGADLGLTTDEWIASLLEDPRWKNYMVRQVLVPGGIQKAGTLDPATNKLLTGKRTGYYNPDQTLSPVMALDMKVHAMGNAYAWNERAKSLVAAEMVQGKITAGGDSVELAKRIQEKRAEIAVAESARVQLGFDGIVNGLNDRMGTLSNAVRKINDEISVLDDVTVKSVYTSGENSEVKSLVADYNSGKLTYAEGVREGSGLSVQEGNTVINNTYQVRTDTPDAPKIEAPTPTDSPTPIDTPPTQPSTPSVGTVSGNTVGEISDSTYKIIDTVVSGDTRHIPGDTNLEVVKQELRRDVSERALSRLEEDGYLKAKQDGMITDDEYIGIVRKAYQDSLDDLLNGKEKALLKKLEAEPKLETPKAETPKVEVPETKTITNPLLGQSEATPFEEKMFHGSGRAKSEVYTGAAVPILGEGKYWAFDRAGAKNFGNNIESSTVSLERPLVIVSDDEWRELTKQAGWEFPNPVGRPEDVMKKETAALKKLVTESGYDGIIIRVGASEDGLLKDVFSINQAVVYGSDDVLSASKASEIKRYGGVTSDGTPYRYTVENGKITSMERVTDIEGMVESLSGINKNFEIDIETAKTLGSEYMAAANRTAMFFKENFPDMNIKSSFVLKEMDEGTYGEVLSNPHIRLADDGTLDIDFRSRLNSLYHTKGNEEKYLEKLRGDVKEDTYTYIPGRTMRAYTNSWHPKNSVDLSHSQIHEATHTLMLQLVQAEENVLIKNGTAIYHYSNRQDFYKAKVAMEESVLQSAAARIGKPLSDDLRAGISIYAVYPRTLAHRNAETITEAIVDYAFNGADAAEFSVAIAQEISTRLQKHSMTISPKATLKENGLQMPKGLLKDDNYNFPSNVKTQAEKAEWLNKWRQKNPYLDGKFDIDTFQKANLWDSYFQKEIKSYDPNSKSAAPDKLIKKSGDFVEQRRAESAKNIVEEIKRLSGDDFDSDLAMIVAGRNGSDISKAIDNYIIRQVDESAEALAKNMDGGLTPENLNTAKVTLWSDESVKTSMKEMIDALVPDGGDANVSKIDILFDEQAKGLAAYDKLPVDSRTLMAEKEALVEELYKENKKVLKEGKRLDKNSSFRDGGSHVIRYKEGGEDVYVTVDDPVIASILQKPYDFKEHGMITESIESVANFLATTYRLGTTGINPMALLRNVLRDPVQAMVTGGFNPFTMNFSPETFYKTLRQYGLDDDTIAEVSQRIRSWAQSGTMTQEMRLGPGKNAKSYRNAVEKVSNGLRDVTNGKLITTLQTPLETWEGFLRNQIGQQSFAKNFRRTGDVDKALGSALFDASNATTNFSHAIGKWKWATSTVPYLSSAVNGTVSFWRLFNVDPIGMTARITAGFMVPVMAITAWNLSSEENRRAYETLPEWFKQSHLIMTDGNGNIMAFPLPEEIQNFAGTARKLMEFTHDVSPYSIPTIAAQGAFGFLPFEVDGFWGDDGSFQLKEGAFQLVSGLIPQAGTTLYEWIFEHDLFTGEDLSTYSGLNKTINTLSNIFGTGIKNAANSIGMMCGFSEKDIIGKSFQDTFARDLFGMGFDAAKNQFMSIIGSPAKLLEDGRMTKPTGMFKENEELKAKVDALSAKIAVATDEEKPGLEEQKQKLINDFTDKVVNAMNNYQRLFQLTGGLEAWQKNRLVQLLTLGDAWSSGESDSYQAGDASAAFLNERGLAQQRYVQAGLPSGPDLENLVGDNSIELQAAINRFYGTPKQATQDYKNAINASGIKDIREEFYSAISRIYDIAEETGGKPDYDLIEKIQARYLQSIDSVLVPIINEYGINILNNNDFIDAVRRQVNGMIPSDDWRQSTKNAKKFLSTKEYPTATVDVKKWLKNRYSSGMRDRGLDSDAEVIQILESIKSDIDAGRRGSAQGKINSLKNGINKSNYYISSKDYKTLTEYNNMVK